MKKTATLSETYDRVELRLEGPYTLRQNFMLSNLLENAPRAIDCLPVLFKKTLASQGLYFTQRSFMEKLGACDVLLISPLDFSSVEKEYRLWLKAGKPKIVPNEIKVKPEMREMLWEIPANENCLEALLQGSTVCLWDCKE